MTVTWETRLRNIPLPKPILLGIGCGLVAHRLRPWLLPGPELLRRAAGLSLIGVGGTLTVWSWWATRRVDLGHPRRLVTAGPYAISRKPHVRRVGTAASRGGNERRLGLDPRNYGARSGDAASAGTAGRATAPRALRRGIPSAMRDRAPVRPASPTALSTSAAMRWPTTAPGSVLLHR